MSHDLYGLQTKRSNRMQRAEAIARKCRLDAEDETNALSIYEGILDALADRMARHDGGYVPKPARVYIAAYQHRYGVDLSAHMSRDQAEARLLSIAWQQCMSDAAIRSAVDARFGPLVADEPPLEPPFEADLHADAHSFSGTDGCDESSSRLRMDPTVRAVRPRSVTAWNTHHDESCAVSLDSDLDSDLDLDRDLDLESAREGGLETGRPSTATSRAAEREDRRRTFCEQLLEEWPQFARGEALWIVECAVEEDDGPSRPESDPESDPESGVEPSSAAVHAESGAR